MGYKRFISVIFLFLLGLHLFAQDKKNSYPSLEPEYVFPFSAVFELTGREIIQISLEFSSCHEDTAGYNDCLEVYDKLEDTVTGSEYKKMDVRQRAEAVLDLMYSEVLTDYDEKQTRMDVLFQSGKYNCVSSSVLYMALCRAAGISVCGNMTPCHAFCTVSTDGSDVDVECTNPLGFDIGSKKIKDESKYYIIPASKYNGRKKVSDRMFVSLVANNLISLFNKEGDYDKAVPYAASRMVFLKDSPQEEYEDARSIFDTVAGNLSASYQKKSAYVDALLWMDMVYRRWGMTPLLQEKYDEAFSNAVIYVCNGGDIDTALSLYNAYKKNVSRTNATSCEYLITHKSLEIAFRDLDNMGCIEYLEKNYDKNLISNKDIIAAIDQYYEYYWYKVIDSYIKSNSSTQESSSMYSDAISLCCRALKDVPSSESINSFKDQILYNYSVYIHNNVARLYNEGQKEEALSVLEEGITFYPDSKVLQNDKAFLSNQ